MSTVKTKFTLHEDYKDFTSGATQLKQDTLVPYSSQGSPGCSLLLSAGAIIMMIMMVFWATYEIAFPFLFQHFSAETTAQVIECEVKKSDRTRSTWLTYTYTWNGRPMTSSASVSYGSTDCNEYLNQMYTIRVLIPDPSHTSLPIAENSRSTLERLGLIGLAIGVAFATFGAAHKYLRDIVLQLYSKARYRRLLRQSILLEGEIIRIHSYKPSKTQDTIVSVTYQFQTPHKKSLTGWAEAKRNDLRDTPLPPVGTPVAVLYADDHAHMML